MQTFFDEAHLQLSGRPDIVELQKLQDSVEERVSIVSSITNYLGDIHRTKHRLHGPCFVANQVARDFAELKQNVWASIEACVSRQIAAGIAAEDGKFHCRVCDTNKIKFFVFLF
ncbi:unnamed protein product [Allacma fusca]|uniref:Uncharacterized protein n=1 Tax=Allacma fusca TaxID=39272 RepID=A0A8J2KVF2_9HEXA|nr:unnamed protein product [Allacma fusca]